MRQRKAAAAVVVAGTLLGCFFEALYLGRQFAASRGLSEIAASVFKAVPAAKRAWPGYDPLDQPALFAFYGRKSLLIGAPRAPRGFSRALWIPGWFTGDALFSRRYFFPSFTFVMNFDLDGSTVTAIRAPEPSDPTRATELLVHERFHHFQDATFVKHAAEAYPVEDASDVALARAEGESLAAWLEKGDEDAVRDFAAARQRRRRLFPGSAAEEEEERLEGTAEFVEWAALDVSSGTAPMRRRMTDELRGDAAILGMGKPRAYATGATLCRWLDAVSEPSWREGVAKGSAPAEIALARLALGEDEVDRRVRRLQGIPAYAEAFRTASKDVKDLDEYRAWSIKAYDALPGRRLVLTSGAARANFSFDGPWVHYPDGSTMMNVAEWVTDRPEIHVRLSRGKTVIRRRVEAEFVVTPGSVVTLDGVPWRFKPGRYDFKTFSISSAPAVWLTAGPGTLDDDGRYVRLSVAPSP